MTPEHLQPPWSVWKINWEDILSTAAVTACLEAGAFAFILYLFVQDSHRLLTIVEAGIFAFWIFNVGVSALNAYLAGRPKISTNPPKR